VADVGPRLRCLPGHHLGPELRNVLRFSLGPRSGCVSDFNTGALRPYRRLGYELVGPLTDFLVTGSAERLLRKSRGPWSSWRPPDG